MDATNWVAVVVAVVAAFSSISAAVLARESARGAQESADGIDRRRHMIEALDVETEAFRAVVTGYFQALHDLSEDSRSGYVKVVTRATQVATDPLCSHDVTVALNLINKEVHSILTSDGELILGDLVREDVGSAWNGMKVAVHAVLVEQARKRQELLRGLSTRISRQNSAN